jgi:hypothetical protein
MENIWINSHNQDCYGEYPKEFLGKSFGVMSRIGIHGHENTCFHGRISPFSLIGIYHLREA